MDDNRKKALEAALYDYWRTPYNWNQRNQLRAAIRTYLRESGIGAVVEAARELHAVTSNLGAALSDDNVPAIKNSVTTNLLATSKLLAAVAALDKEPGE